MEAEATFPRLSAPPASATQGGVSLLEVLIALLVLAIGVLGAVLLQTNALRYSASAADQTQASFIAYDLLDRMRANPANLASYALTVSAGCTTASPAASILAVDLADFTHAVSCLLPAGQGSVELDGQQATVTIGWSEERIVVGGGTASLVVSALIGGDP